MGDRYELGFAPALRFLRSQILCRPYKSPSDESTNRDHIRTLKIPYACESSVDYENTKLTQHALKTCHYLHNIEVGHNTKEREETQAITFLSTTLIVSVSTKRSVNNPIVSVPTGLSVNNSDCVGIQQPFCQQL